SAPPLKHRISTSRGSMDEGIDTPGGNVQLPDPLHETDRLLAGRRRNLRDAKAAGVAIDEHEIRESAADIDAELVSAQLSSPRCPRPGMARCASSASRQRATQMLRRLEARPSVIPFLKVLREC